jgi:tetratricopeptide (TPR) repeat protein
MSLLLEALKKAEKAKEEAQRGAKSEAGELQLEGGEASHVRTRDELPDISQPVEIASDDLQAREAAAPPAAAPALALEEETPAPTRREPARAAAAPERAAARNVFEAKFKEPNPRMPFYVTMGTLGVAAIGTAIYFYIQLQPPPPLVNANPPRPAGEKPVEVAQAKPAAGPAAPAAPAQPALPGLPAAPAAPAAAAPAAAAPPPPKAAAPAPKPPAATRPRPDKPEAPRAAALVKPERPVTVSRAPPQVHPGVSTGYTAYQAGDLAAARNAYQQALREDPANRDALLGMAAVEMRGQRYELAEGYYQRLLHADPRDPHAQAGMLALRGAQIDPVQGETRVKTLLASDPESAVLHFALGNQYAQQARWAEAQQSYFKAHAADPENPDFAFNLAVALDQLHQRGLALEYYRRALALAEKRAPGFSPDAARARAQQLVR